MSSFLSGLTKLAATIGGESGGSTSVGPSKDMGTPKGESYGKMVKPDANQSFAKVEEIAQPITKGPQKISNNLTGNTIGKNGTGNFGSKTVGFNLTRAGLRNNAPKVSFRSMETK